MGPSKQVNTSSLEEELLAPIFYIDENYYGVRHYKRIGEDSFLHREGGPAIIEDDYRAWFIDGKPHRVDGPARMWEHENKEEWWLNGELHREDGPAATSDNGQTQRWVLHGKLHRVDGPAVIKSDGFQEWWVNGELHREDGPAVIGPSHKRWYRSGKLHREDGPAAENSESEEWHLNGELHRVDGPAVKYDDGYEEWWQNGFLHRLDGPALIPDIYGNTIIEREGIQENQWWLFGVEVSQDIVEHFLILVQQYFEIDKIVEIPYGVLKEIYESSHLKQ